MGIEIPHKTRNLKVPHLGEMADWKKKNPPTSKDRKLRTLICSSLAFDRKYLL